MAPDLRFFMRVGVVLLALAIGPALGGCALFVRTPTPPPASTGPQAQRQWQQHLAILRTVQRFTLNARMAAKGVGWSGNLHWEQDGKHIKLVVSGPLGVGGLLATGTVKRAYIETPKKKFWTNDPEATFKHYIGWELPIRYVRYWVLGMPVPSLGQTHTLNAQGLLRTLHQAGWDITYAAYQSAGKLQLPRALDFIGPDVQVRVVIDRWEL